MADTRYIKLTAVTTPVFPGRDILVAMLGELEFESFVDIEDGVEAFIPEPAFDKAALAELVDNCPDDIEWEIRTETVEVENYNAQWESNFQRVEVGKALLIRAPFHEQDPSFTHEIIISPKMAFGTGHHETTWLIANDMSKGEWRGKKVLDMGCGTGVLALYAEKLGANEIVAIDIDPWSTENTAENAGLNDSSITDIRLGDASEIAVDSFDVILANINRNILLNDMSTYVNAMNPNAEIWFSGFFKSDVDAIRKAGEESGLRFLYTESKGDWAMVKMTKAGN